MITTTLSIEHNDIAKKNKFIEYCTSNKLSFVQTATTKDGIIYDISLPDIKAIERLNTFLS